MDREAPKARGLGAQLHKRGRRWQLPPHACQRAPSPSRRRRRERRCGARGGARIVQPTAARAGAPHPLPSSPPPPPLPPTSREPQQERKKGSRGKARPPGLQPRRENSEGKKQNLGSRLREERGAGSRGPADASGSSTSLREPSPARAPGPPNSWPGLATAAPDRPGARGPPDGELEGRRGYLSGVGFGLRRLKEGVRQLPEPHGHCLRHVGRLGVHDGVEKRLQVCLRVPSDVHDLVSGRGRLRRRLGARGCRLPGPGRWALPLGGLRGRLPLALGGRLRRRLLPGIHGFCLPRRAPRPGGRGLRPGAPARRAEAGEAARAAGCAGLRERRSPRSQGRGAAPRPRIPRPGASAPALRPGSTGLAAAPREGLRETRTCGA